MSDEKETYSLTHCIRMHRFSPFHCKPCGRERGANHLTPGDVQTVFQESVLTDITHFSAVEFIRRSCSLGRFWPTLLWIALLGLFFAGTAYCVMPSHNAPTVDPTLASYATDLGPRTAHQRYNARRAAAALDGVVIPKGGDFSFNTIVRGWTADRGFLKAPVSYDGALIDDYGGGVCQTSTTIYNAALLAGLPILERYPHTFAPSYAPPGRDAAVAFPGVDLRFHNPYPWPLTLHIQPSGHMLVCKITAPNSPRVNARLTSSVLDHFSPAAYAAKPGAGFRRSRWRLKGRDGVRVIVYRDLAALSNTHTRREIVSDDTYAPISRVAWAKSQ